MFLTIRSSAIFPQTIKKLKMHKTKQFCMLYYHEYCDTVFQLHLYCLMLSSSPSSRVPLASECLRSFYYYGVDTTKFQLKYLCIYPIYRKFHVKCWRVGGVKLWSSENFKGKKKTLFQVKWNP